MNRHWLAGVAIGLPLVALVVLLFWGPSEPGDVDDVAQVLTNSRSYSWRRPPVLIPRGELGASGVRQLENYLTAGLVLATDEQGVPDTKPVQDRLEKLNRALSQRLLEDDSRRYGSPDWVTNRYRVQIYLGEVKVVRGLLGKSVQFPYEMTHWDHGLPQGTTRLKGTLSIALK